MSGDGHIGDRGSRGDAEAPSERERRLLAQWLREWRCDQALRRDEPPGAAPAGGSPAQAIAGGRPQGVPAPAVRQIRLLHPSDSGRSSRPLFVAVFARPAPFLFRAAPFGRFSSPAVPGELETGRPQVPLRVLCVWNARTLHEDVLARGWDAGRLTAAEMTAAAALDRHDGPHTMPGGYAERTGPRLRHPADPRRLYIRQEAALMDRVCREGAEEEGVYSVLPWPALPAGGEVAGAEARLAAEGASPYGARHAWRLPEHPVCIEIDAPSTPGQPCAVTVRSVQGAVSDLLDGAFVVGSRRIARILAGRALVLPGDLPGGLRLYDREGARIRIGAS